MEKYKVLKEKKDLYIEFSDEELQELGWKHNQKLSIEMENNGGISIKPYVTVDIDMSDYPKEILEWLIQQSAEQDLSINEIISRILETYIDEEKILKKISKKCKATLLCENELK